MIVFFIVLVVLVIGGWWYFSGTPVTVPTPPTTSMVPPEPTKPAGPDLSPAGVSDAALNQDAADIDQEIIALGTDTQNVDQGLNDQPVSQAE